MSSYHSNGMSTALKVVLIVAAVFLVIMLASVSVGIIVFLASAGGATIPSGDIAVVPLHGVILTTGDDFFADDVITSDHVITQLRALDADSSIDAIILDINSPGGSPVASDEIGRAIRMTSKPIVAVIRDLGASGGYWVASSADYVIANRMSITGSIGVTSATLGVEGLIDELNISYRRLVAGEFKDAGTPFREPTSEEGELFQSLLDTMHDEFINEVALNRNMSHDDVRDLATGWVYLGSEAKDLGLVDELGGPDEALWYLEDVHNITGKVAVYGKNPNFFSLLTGFSAQSAYHIGQGIGDALTPEQKTEILLLSSVQ